MPRPMLNAPQNESRADELLSLNRNFNKPVQKLDNMQLDRLLRKPRSKEYMEAMHTLDAGGHVHNQGKINDMIAVIKAEFPEVELSGILIGIVSICYLGKPYEVHSLDYVGNIIEHFQVGQPLPKGMEKARGIALHGGYEFIEVYTDCCRAVSADGTVSVIRN